MGPLACADVTPEDIERLEKLQRLEREGDQAVRR
jgi:hypothetical protein